MYYTMKRKILGFIWLLFLGSGMYAQQTITGTITDISNEPIPGANIVIKGTTVGTTTDVDGNYSISNVSSDNYLEISFIGMLTEEVEVGSQTEISLSLIPDIMQLEDVVVVGYGTVKKKDLTGAVVSLGAEDIENTPTANTMEALQGKIAGLDITNSSGSAGGDLNILLRGHRSISKDDDDEFISCEPLYIIDGMEGSIDNLNPNDIVSIDVLKDASSTAIYGSEGANGVIMITTKQGEVGKTQVDFSTYVSISGNPSYPSALSGDAWLDYLKEGYKANNDNEDPSDQSTLLSKWKISYAEDYINDGKWVDWVDESLQTGYTSNTYLSVKSGNEKIQSNFSLGYNKTNGIYKNDYLDKYTLRENLKINMYKNVKAGIITGLTYRNRESRSSRINKAFSMVPLGNVYDENGDINLYPLGEENEVINLLADNIDEVYKNNTKNININANPYIEISFLKDFNFKTSLNTSLSAKRQGLYNSGQTYTELSSSDETSDAAYSTAMGYGYKWENILNYNKSINEHNFGATVVTSYSVSIAENSYAYAEDILYNDYLYYNLGAGDNYSVSSGYEEYKKMSYVGRVNYNYASKYYITGSVRYDGVSQLVDQWDIFPAGSVAWRISEEDFMESSKDWLSSLKLRLGYGIAGSDNISAYSSLTEITNGEDNINLGGGKLLTTVPTQSVSNDELGWEKTYSTNLGIDFGLIKGRIDGSVDYYNQDTRDIIYNRSLPFTNGGYSAKTAYKRADNIASMNNKGLEITLNTRNIQGKDFKWSSNFTFAFNKEKVTSIDLENGTTSDDLISEDLFIGEALDTKYSYKKIGIWQSEEAEDAAVFGLEPGDVKVATNLTKVSDGVWKYNNADSTTEYTSDNQYTISADDKQILGHENPDWTFGFINTFTYKDFDLTVNVTGRWGQTIKGALLGYFTYGSVNIPENYNYWTEDNPTNDYPRPYLSRDNDAALGYDALQYIDASYIKVKNITLGYTLPTTISEKARIQKLRVYATMYNSFIYTKSKLLKGIDPESGASDSYPLYKQMVFGLNVSF